MVITLSDVLPESIYPLSPVFKAKINSSYIVVKRTLIDPNSAGKLPHILDLRLAILLFHNELSTAPGRLFLVEEWNYFKSGYLEYVSLTDTEYRLW